MSCPSATDVLRLGCRHRRAHPRGHHRRRAPRGRTKATARQRRRLLEDAGLSRRRPPASAVGVERHRSTRRRSGRDRHHLRRRDDLGAADGPDRDGSDPRRSPARPRRRAWRWEPSTDFTTGAVIVHHQRRRHLGPRRHPLQRAGPLTGGDAAPRATTCVAVGIGRRSPADTCRLRSSPPPTAAPPGSPGSSRRRAAELDRGHLRVGDLVPGGRAPGSPTPGETSPPPAVVTADGGTTWQTGDRPVRRRRRSHGVACVPTTTICFVSGSPSDASNGGGGVASVARLKAPAARRCSCLGTCAAGPCPRDSPGQGLRRRRRTPRVSPPRRSGCGPLFASATAPRRRRPTTTHHGGVLHGGAEPRSSPAVTGARPGPHRPSRP